MAVFFYYYTVSRSDRMWTFFYTYGQMDNIFYLVTLSWLYDLLIIILCDVPIDSGRSFLLNIRWTIYVSWWRYHGSVFVDYYTVWCSDKTVDVLFYLRSDGQYIFVGETIMNVLLFIIMLCDVLIDSGHSCLPKIRWTIYLCWWDYYDCVFYPRSDGQYILLGDTAMAVFVVDYYTVWCSDRQWVFFLLKVRWKIYSDAIMAVLLCTIILCDVLIRQWTFFST